jgi:hypothetical protein
MSNTDDRRLDVLKMVPLSHVERRATRTSTQMTLDPLPEHLAFQHTVLCQTSMPYRNQGDAMRKWEHKQGNVFLLIEAGTALHPVTDTWVELGLPFGPKPRLILAHLNAEALRQWSPVIAVEDSLTAFVRRIQDPLKTGKSGPNGHEIGVFKGQLSRLDPWQTTVQNARLLSHSYSPRAGESRNSAVWLIRCMAWARSCVTTKTVTDYRKSDARTDIEQVQNAKKSFTFRCML